MIRVAILGATGYTALELIKMLLRHPRGRDHGAHQPPGGQPARRRRSIRCWPAGSNLALEDLGPAAVGSRADCVFSCLPHGVTATLVPQLLDAGARVIDFSADYRLDDAGTLRRMVRPEARRSRRGWARSSTACRSCSASRFAEAKLVANPGCYPTSAILALAPLLKAGLIEPDGHHRRLQERRLRRGPHAEADHALSRVQREHLGLQRRPASPHAGDRAGPRPRQRPARWR